MHRIISPVKSGLYPHSFESTYKALAISMLVIFLDFDTKTIDLSKWKQLLLPIHRCSLVKK